MESDTPCCPETYPPIPSAVITPKENKYITGKFLGLLVLGSFLWSFIIFGGIIGFIQLGYSNNFIPDHICNARVENATNISSTQCIDDAYPKCLNYMEELVLSYKVLPVLMEDGNITYLNLTKYYDLNKTTEEK